jgi:alpha-1,3-mannosylglycoprotein beta-1,4-N-acetylglucosaminyltransferase A/B
MMYCQPKGSFYVQLEDDLEARPQYQALMKKTALQTIADGKEWFILDFGGLGFIGKSY